MRRASRACGSPSKLGKVPTVRHHTSRFPQVPHPTSPPPPAKVAKPPARFPFAGSPSQSSQSSPLATGGDSGALPLIPCQVARLLVPASASQNVPAGAAPHLKNSSPLSRRHKVGASNKNPSTNFIIGPRLLLLAAPPVVVDVTTASHFAPPRPLAKPVRRPPAPACDCARPGVAPPA